MQVDFPWKIRDSSCNCVLSSGGFSAELGGSIGGEGMWGLDVNVGIPLLFFNTFIFEPYGGINAYFPPGARIGSNDHPEDGFGRWQYGYGIYFRPIGFYSLSSDKQLYPFIGMKQLWLRGLGQLQEALDCLYCSDISESYSIDSNLYLISGLSWRLHRWDVYTSLEVRLTDNKGSFGEIAHDPWDVGPEFDRVYGPYTEPKVMFSVGGMFLPR